MLERAVPPLAKSLGSDAKRGGKASGFSAGKLELLGSGVVPRQAGVQRLEFFKGQLLERARQENAIARGGRIVALGFLGVSIHLGNRQLAWRSSAVPESVKSKARCDDGQPGADPAPNDLPVRRVESGASRLPPWLLCSPVERGMEGVDDDVGDVALVAQVAGMVPREDAEHVAGVATIELAPGVAGGDWVASLGGHEPEE